MRGAFSYSGTEKPPRRERPGASVVSGNVARAILWRFAPMFRSYPSTDTFRTKTMAHMTREVPQTRFLASLPYHSDGERARYRRRQDPRRCRARKREKPPGAAREGRPGGFSMPCAGDSTLSARSKSCSSARGPAKVGRPRGPRSRERPKVAHPSESAESAESGAGRLSTLTGSISTGPESGRPTILRYLSATSSAVGSSRRSSTWRTIRSAWSV